MKAGTVVQIVMAGLASAAAAGSAIGQERFSSEPLVAFPIGNGGGYLMLRGDLVSAAQRGEIVGGAVPLTWGSEGGVPLSVGKELDGCIRFDADPVIGAQMVGIINATDTAVTFSVEQGGKKAVHALAGREIVTLELPSGTSLKASISTQDHFETADLVGGTLYEVRGNDEHRWVFAKR